MNPALVSQTLEREIPPGFEPLKSFPSEEGAEDEEMGPRQHPWSREGAFPNYPPLVVCPSSSNQANKAGKWDFEWQDPVVASILTPAGGGKKSREMGE